MVALLNYCWLAKTAVNKIVLVIFIIFLKKNWSSDLVLIWTDSLVLKMEN